jgi:adenine-specific DNA-methyltransferase
MNTLNYIGSKHTLLNTLLYVCKENIENLDKKTFLDLFDGTGSVGFVMNEYFASCSANDLEYYSYIINYALLMCIYTENIEKIIGICNNLDLIAPLVL